jgi:hypothetical protein
MLNQTVVFGTGTNFKPKLLVNVGGGRPAGDGIGDAAWAALGAGDGFGVVNTITEGMPGGGAVGFGVAGPGAGATNTHRKPTVERRFVGKSLRRHEDRRWNFASS